MTAIRHYARTAGVIAGLVAFGAAYAAPTVETLGGTVRVNQGKGFATLQGASAVKAGDTIMADPKGKGRLVYSDGCTVNVKPGALVTVAEVSPCSLNAQTSDDRDRKDGGGFALTDPSTGLLIAGGAAAAGIGAAVALGSNGGSGTPGIIPFIPPKPASP